MPVKDLVGKKFNKLTVLRRDLTKRGGAAYWICQCDCGKQCSVRGSSLTTQVNPTRSCGCLNKTSHQIDTTSQIGKKYGRLTVLERDLTKEIGHGKSSYWICQCECGKICSISFSQLSSKGTQSCGCLRSELVTSKNKKDITDQRFGMVVAKERLAAKSNHNCYLWRCECDCGNDNYICSTENLLSGRIHSCGCNKKSYGEQLIEKILLENNIHFAKEFAFSDLRGKNNQYLRFDFAILNENNFPKKLIEFDGEQHYDKTSRFYSEQLILNDQAKNKYAKNNNIPLVRIPYHELNNLSLELLFGDKYLL